MSCDTVSSPGIAPFLDLMLTHTHRPALTPVAEPAAPGAPLLRDFAFAADWTIPTPAIL